MLLDRGKESILDFIKPTHKVLDIGGGKGTRWKPILEKFPDLQLTFFEPDKKELEVAKLNLSGWNVKFVNDLTIIPESSTDLIFSFAVLEHVWSKENFFKNISRILNESGTAYISYDDGHFRSYLFKDLGEMFIFKNSLKTKMYPIWQIFKIYNKYQRPVDAKKLAKIIGNQNLTIKGEYFSAINFLKNMSFNDRKFSQNTINAIYNLEKQLNLEYQFHKSNKVFNKHGPLWNIMSTRTLEIVHKI